MDKGQKQSIQVLANCEGMFFEKGLKKHLYTKYKIVSKNIGIDKSTKNMKDFIIEPYLLDKISVAFLLQKQPDLFDNSQPTSSCKQVFEQINSSLELKVFKELKQKYFLIPGHKFGSTFLAYDQNPEKHHATSLIFCGTKQQRQSDFNQMTRLAEIAKKECLFAYLNEQNQQITVEKLQRQKAQNTKRNNKRSKVQLKSDGKNI